MLYVYHIQYIGDLIKLILRLIVIVMLVVQQHGHKILVKDIVKILPKQMGGDVIIYQMIVGVIIIVYLILLSLDVM